MPFDTELDFVCPVIKEAVEKAGMDCFRTDERVLAEPVIEDVKNQIAASDPTFCSPLLRYVLSASTCFVKVLSNKLADFVNNSMPQTV